METESIEFRKIKLFLDGRIQYTNGGNEIKYVGLRVNSSIPSQFVGGMYRSHWIYMFRYNDGRLIEIEMDYYGKTKLYVREWDSDED